MRGTLEESFEKGEEDVLEFRVRGTSEITSEKGEGRFEIPCEGYLS